MRGFTRAALVARDAAARALSTAAARSPAHAGLARAALLSGVGGTCKTLQPLVLARGLCTPSGVKPDPRELAAMETIKENVRSKPLVLFMKGTPALPQCGFSKHVCDLLRANGVDDKDIFSHNVLADDFIRSQAKEFSEWPTFPQLYVNGEFIGGCDILHEMHVNKELGEVLKDISAAETSAE